MRDPLHRLHRTKLALLATILTAVGVALLLVAQWTAGLGWLGVLPLGEIGSTLFTAGLLGILLDYLDQQDADERANQRLRKVLKAEAPAIRDAVIHGFAFEPDDLAKVASPAALDAIATNALTIQLGDRDLAEGVYGNLRRQVLAVPERVYDARVSVALAPWKDGPAHDTEPMLVATIRRQYHLKPSTPVVRFSCVSDMAEYHELLVDPTTAEVSYFEPAGELTAASPGVFELLEFTVNGKKRPIRPAKRANASLYTVALDPRLTEPTAPEVEIAYTFRLLVKRHGHVLYLEVGRPTKGAEIELHYGGCGISYVNALAFGGSAPSKVWRSPAGSTTPSVSVSFDGWMLPRAGVGFVWVLEGEIGAGRS